MRKSIGLILLAANLVAACAAADSPQPALRVHGRELLWGGKPVMIRGVAVGDAILAREGRPASDYQRIAKEWNANTVRIDIHPMLWKHRPHEKVLDGLGRDVKAALDAGLFVIIDWHVIGWPDGYFQKPGADWDVPNDFYDSGFALAESFWGEVAERFGKEPRVMFELWNEPVQSADENGDEGPKKWKALKPYWEKLTAIIRKKSQNVVLAAGSQWAYRLDGVKKDLLRDPNTAYVWHIYAGHDGNDPKQWAAALDDLQEVRPVIVTEWGFQEKSEEHFKGSAKEFGVPFVRDFLEKKKLHSTAWCWHPDWTPVMLRKDWKTPTAFGRFVQEYLKDPSAAGKKVQNGAGS